VPTGSLTSSTSLLPTASASSGLTILASGPIVT
jgi:hypothetical protein